MLCGGLTVYSPLKRFGVGPGSKVAVCRVEGLGHYPIQVRYFSHLRPFAKFR